MKRFVWLHGFGGRSLPTTNIIEFFCFQIILETTKLGLFEQQRVLETIFKQN